MSLNRLTTNTHLSRHSHDVSAGYTFSLASGMIIPTYFDILQPGDSVYYKTKVFARMQDLVTAFLGEVDLHFDYFFVPLQMIFTPFGAKFSGTNDVLSASHVNIRNTDDFPMLEKYGLVNSLHLQGRHLYHKECIGKETARLLDAFDMNPLAVFSPNNIANSFPNFQGDTVLPAFADLPTLFAPWIPCAYQAIYQKYYRNDEFEKFDIRAYNVDEYYSSTNIPTTLDMFKLRYVGRYDDYFTSTRVSPISSAVNQLSSLNYTSDSARFPAEGGQLSSIFDKVNDYLGFGTSAYLFERKLDTDTNIYPSDSRNSLYWDATPPSFGASSVGQNTDWFPSAANIRSLFAVDKFMRIYGRAKKTYDDQILAHFGIEIPHDVKHDLTHLKHYRIALTSDPIYATADVSGGSSLGQVGAQSNGMLDSEKEKFTAPVHGVFMCVCYAKSKPRYFGTMSKLHQLCDRLQFPQPEFDKLGSQPLYGWEFSPRFVHQGIAAQEPWKIRCGWQNRYQEFKKKYNRISLIFADPDLYWGQHQSLSPAPANTFAPYVLGRMPFDDSLIWSQYGQDSSGEDDLTGYSSMLNVANFFETPDSLNSVMAVPYSGEFSESFLSSPASMFDTDPIFLDFFADVNKVSWMSETGEPDL